MAAVSEGVEAWLRQRKTSVPRITIVITDILRVANNAIRTYDAVIMLSSQPETITRGVRVASPYSRHEISSIVLEALLAKYP